MRKVHKVRTVSRYVLGCTSGILRYWQTATKIHPGSHQRSSAFAISSKHDMEYWWLWGGLGRVMRFALGAFCIGILGRPRLKSAMLPASLCHSEARRFCHNKRVEVYELYVTHANPGSNHLPQHTWTSGR